MEIPFQISIDYSIPQFLKDWPNSTDFDTRIICADGECHAHRLVLCHVSPYVGESLDDQFPGEETVIIIPDTPVAVMEKMLELAYTGSMIVSPAVLVVIEEYMKYLGWVCLATCEKSEYSQSQPNIPTPSRPVRSPMNAESQTELVLSENETDTLPPLQDESKNLQPPNEDSQLINIPLTEEPQNISCPQTKPRRAPLGEDASQALDPFFGVELCSEEDLYKNSQSATFYPSSNYTETFAQGMGFSESYSQVLSPAASLLENPNAKHPQYDAIFDENGLKRNLCETADNNSGNMSEYSANPGTYPSSEKQVRDSLPVFDTDKNVATQLPSENTLDEPMSIVASDRAPEISVANTTWKKGSLGLSRGVPPKGFDSSQEFSPGLVIPSPNPCNLSSQDDFKTLRRTRSSVLSKLTENGSARPRESSSATPKRSRMVAESEVSTSLKKTPVRETRQTKRETSPGNRETRTSSRNKSKRSDKTEPDDKSTKKVAFG